ncbi:hypothetical protein Z042_02110 [Chania multitudinisentens RB-25]|uniref:Uncharacterized protein TP-0789 domain-containing protein n=1 Tax=Chania multitudinisentens RB-25 TaxID=1441930 RepID=W0L835_9GAMM|nr:hypothetical protein Z042_02110 [Chania multitudinisentens RB-25]
MFVPSVLAEPSVEQRLKQADSYRQEAGSIKAEVGVNQFVQGSLKATQLYDVYTKPGKGSLVVFKSAAEAGQKMLMQDDNYWLFMPKSRRPIRITPMQKLLGDASVGDISSLSWSESYRAEVKQPKLQVNGEDALELLLEAKSKGASYHKIELVLSASDSFPLAANLYLQSGKLAKTAQFSRGVMNNHPAVISMKLLDGIQQKNETIIEFKGSRTIDIDDKLFNPSYLVRNNLENI